MFNSQRINNDPFPWVAGGSGYRWPHPAPGVGRWDFRPEYDNNPNPILVSFREDTNPHAESWFESLDNNYRDVTFGPQDWTEKHIDHARKVLERLVNVYSD